MRLSLVTATLLLLLATATAAHTQYVVTPAGLGPVKFNMTVKQFSRSLKEPMTEPEDPSERGCFYLEAKKYPGVAFMFEDGRLHRIDVQSDRVATSDGIRLGTTIEDVKRRFGARIVDEPHFYSGPEDRYLTMSLNSTTAIRFETSGGKVDNFYLGHKAQVKYVEGCL